MPSVFESHSLVFVISHCNRIYCVCYITVLKQRAFTEFLTADQANPINIHRPLQVIFVMKLWIELLLKIWAIQYHRKLVKELLRAILAVVKPFFCLMRIIDRRLTN